MSATVSLAPVSGLGCKEKSQSSWHEAWGHIVFTAYQGRCAHCKDIHTVRPKGIDVKSLGIKRFKRSVSISLILSVIKKYFTS